MGYPLIGVSFLTMSNFKIEFDEVKNLKKTFGKGASEAITEAMTDSILNFHKLLESRVNTLYAAPGLLSDVRIGKTINLEGSGRTILRYSLQYREKAIPLHEYPFDERASASFSSHPKRLGGNEGLGYVKWTRGQYSYDYPVEVRRGRPKLQENRKGYKPFVRNGILVSRKRQTWHVRPSYGIKGTRTKLYIKFGPSLARLAEVTYDKDPYVNQAIDILDSVLADELEKVFR